MATVGDGTGMVDVGIGFDRVDFEWPEVVEGDWLFDNGAQALTKDGATQFGWAGLEGFNLPELASNPVSFRGSDSGESVSAGSVAWVELGGGADGFGSEYNFFEEQTPEPGVVDGGTGRDNLSVNTDDDVVVDLTRDRVTFADSDHMDDLLLEGFENVTAYAGRNRVEIRGDAGDNVIRADACLLTVSGAGGDDRVNSTAWDCWKRSGATLRGGQGNDVLRGADTRDRLRGGPGEDRMFGRGGRDVAHGGDGRDICAAEVRRSCRKL
jgi:Ca2+-binding RTX toxin-like protein